MIGERRRVGIWLFRECASDEVTRKNKSKGRRELIHSVVPAVSETKHPFKVCTPPPNLRLGSSLEE